MIHDGNCRSPCCIRDPYAYRGFYGQRRSAHGAHGACVLVCRSSWFLGHDEQLYGRDPPWSLRRICKWNPRPPNRSSGLAGYHSIDQHAPVKYSSNDISGLRVGTMCLFLQSIQSSDRISMTASFPPLASIEQQTWLSKVLRKSAQVFILPTNFVFQ